MSTALERFFRIGEVAEQVGVETHVLRYWETEFPQLCPGKSEHGQRIYHRRDVETALTIKRLLYDEGFTISGARRRLGQLEQEQPTEPAPEPLPPETSSDNTGAVLRRLRSELAEILAKLSRR